MMMQCLQSYPCPILSQSLPPVSVALHQRILRVATSTPSPNASHPSPRITSFSTWLDAWNIYIATIVAHNPATALELLEYQHLIHSATFTWLKYEAQFGTLAASNPILRWDLRHSELRLDSLAIQTGPSLSARTVMPVGRSYVTSLHQPDQVLTILWILTHIHFYIALLHCTVDDAYTIINKLGRGALLSKIDLNNAFRLMPVWQQNWN